MSKIVWDQIGEHYFETGVSNGVLYTSKTTESGGTTTTDPYGKALLVPKLLLCGRTILST